MHSLSPLQVTHLILLFSQTGLLFDSVNFTRDAEYRWIPAQRRASEYTKAAASA